MVSAGPDEEELIKRGLVICRSTHKSHPFGIFYGQNPLEFSFPLMLLEISLVIIMTRIVRYVLKPLKQPRVVSEIIGGIIVGPSVLGRNKKFATHVFPDNAIFVIQNFAVIGIMYFLFLYGVKLDVSVVKKAGRKHWWIAVVGIFIPLAATTCVTLALKSSMTKQLAMGASIWGVCSSISITSFPVLYPIIKDFNLISSDIGRMALSITLISDIIGIIGVVIFEAIIQEERKRIAALWYLICVVVLTFVITVVIRRLMLLIVRSTPEGKPVEQIFVIGILLSVMVMAFLTDMCGIAIANGPMWFGIVVPDGPPLGATIVEKTETFVNEVLMPFFYAYIGLLTDVTTMGDIWSNANLKPLLFVASVGYITKLVGTLAVTRYLKMPIRDSVALSVILSLRGQVEVLLFMHWMDLKIITRPDFTLMVLLTLVVTGVLSPFINIVYDPTRPYMVNRRRNIQHTPQNTELHIVVSIHDEESVAGFLNLLEVSNPTLSSPFSVYALRLVELIGRASPLFIDHENQDHASNYHTNHNSIHNALKLFQETSEFIRIYSFTSVTPKRTMYRDICELALIKKASLIILPFTKETSIQSINANVLLNAPCSVGILVDKGSSRTHLVNTSMRTATHHFVVLFLGGPDAREALAYADRMAGNTEVSLTVIRFLSLNGEGDDEMEKKLDDGLVTWFWVKNEGNEKVVYREVVVKNGEETVAAIQAMNCDYFDLWIVGRKQGINPVLTEGLSNWSENVELGVVGDFVSSMDLLTTASVLVVQQQILRGQEKEGSLIQRLSRCSR